MSPRALAWKGGGGGERRTHSFLVRLWVEPREQEGESVAIRGYFRNLQTGEERFVTEPRAIANLLERSVEVSEQSEEALRRQRKSSHEIPRSS